MAHSHPSRIAARGASRVRVYAASRFQGCTSVVPLNATWLAGAFALGALVAVATALVPMVPRLPLLALVAVVVGLGGSALAGWQRGAAFAVVLLIAGCYASGTLQAGLDRRLPVAQAPLDVVVRGQVLAPPTRGERALHLHLRLEQPARWRRLGLSWYDAPVTPQRGARWQLCVRLRAPGGAVNPGGRDAEARALRLGVDAVGHVLPCADNRRLSPPAGLAALRNRLRDALLAWPNGDLLAPLVTADSAELPAAMRGWLQATGTSHLFVISGLHVSMVSMVVLAACGLLQRLSGPAANVRRVRLLMALAAALAAAGYVGLAGFGLSTQRAWLMTAVGLLAWASGRRVLAWPAFTLALAVVLASDPLAPLDAGFWLSFSVVAALLVGFAGGRSSGWQAMVRSQWVALIGLLPVLVAVTGGVPWLAPLTNLIMIPWVAGLVVPAALLGAALYSAGLVTLAAWPWWLADRAIAPLPPLLEVLATHAGPLPVAGMPAALLWVVALGSIAWLLPRALGLRLAPALLMVLALGVRPAAPVHGSYRVVVFDVGQGLAVLVRTARHALLYDTGSGSASGTMFAARIAPSLSALGVGRLDLAIISHGDNDHAGGAAALMGSGLLDGPLLAGEPGRLVLPQGSHALRACRPGMRWRWDAVRFVLLHGGAGGSGNDRSCVLLVTDGRHHALLPGDISRGVEQLLARRDRLAPAPLSLVLAPHHGSATSSGGALRSHAGGADVIFSAGRDNPFDHPDPGVVSAWQEVGARTWSTAGSGALLWQDGHIERRWRCTPRLWRAPCDPAAPGERR